MASIQQDLDDDDDDEERELPSYLEGSLPDWALDQVRAANGSSFGHLSLFEPRRLSPKAAIEDEEALYA